MPSALGQSVRERVKQLWFAGETRKSIAAECQIGAGSVTNIIDELKGDLESSDYESMREVAVQLKKERMTFAELFAIYRRHNYIEKLGANEEEVESFILNLLEAARSIPQEKIVEYVNQLYKLSKTESIAPAEVPAYVKQKIEEKHTLEEEIRQSHVILDQKHTDIRTIEEYKKLKEELNRRGISTGDPRRFASVLQAIDRIRSDPGKIVTGLARIRSLKLEERRLKSDCRMWESRAIQYRQVLPLCQQIARFGIGVGELLAFHAAVFKRADDDGISMDTAPYRVLEDIENYNRLGGLKKELNKTIMNIQMMNLVSARQNTAANSVMRLFSFGITEDQILEACKFIEANGRNSNPYYTQSNNFSSFVNPP